MYLVRTFLQSCFSTLSNIYDGKFCENRSRHLESKIRLYGNIPDSLMNRLCLIACLACYKRVHVPTCIACLRAHVPTCPACLRAHVPTCFTYLRASVLWIFTCSWEPGKMCNVYWYRIHTQTCPAFPFSPVLIQRH